METRTIEPLAHELETTGLTPNYRFDLRTLPPDVWVDASATNWAELTWDTLGRPYRVENYSSDRAAWEAEHGENMPVEIQWEHFNRRFHRLFMTNFEDERAVFRKRFLDAVKSFTGGEVGHVMQEIVQQRTWNYVHRIQDAVWDPRGKRALFEGLDVKQPRILYLGAADGYEAMQLLAMYPGGHAVLVDYDDFCRTDRFGAFPDAYPFLGRNPATGGWRVYRREDFQCDFVVDDIGNLKYGKEFDIVLSVGLIEHFPDAYKPMVFDFHRRFLKPGGYALFTTPRRQVRSRLFYLAMGELMNYGYRELMDAHQLGLYAYESGFEILRCGHIKAHNGVVARVR